MNKELFIANDKGIIKFLKSSSSFDINEVSTMIDVEYINLPGVTLKGDIELLENLYFLKYLSLKNCKHIDKNIIINWDFICKFPDLQYLDLSNFASFNLFNGDISKLTNLKCLILDNCSVTDHVLEQIINLPRLEKLILCNNNLPSDIQQKLQHIKHYEI